MKALYLLVPLGLAVLGGCSTTYTTPAVVSPAPYSYYVAPNTIVMGSAPAWIDSDGDGVPNHLDNYPYDSRFR